jgi:hypothetical protein
MQSPALVVSRDRFHIESLTKPFLHTLESSACEVDQSDGLGLADLSGVAPPA